MPSVKHARRNPGPAAPQATTAAIRPGRTPGRLLLVLVLVATGLRLWNLQEGLPDFFDEAFPFRRAFDMAGWESGRVEWNPHAFHYPSLTFYVYMATQWIHYLLGWLLGAYSRPADYFVALHVDPTAMVTAGRLVGVLAHAAIVLGVAVIGERLRRGAGLLAGLLVALSATLIRDARTIYTDALMAAFAIWALERMLAYRAGAGGRTLAACAVMIGLAAGAKYPAALLVLPLAWAVSRQHGGASAAGGGAGHGVATAPDRRRALARWALASGAAVVVFLLTSPFLLQSFAEARFDLLRIANQMSGGQLGTFDRPIGLFYLQVLVRDFGLAAPFLLVASAFLAWRGERRLRPMVGIWLFVLALAIPVAVTRVEFERYLVPIEPAVALLVATAAVALPDLARTARPIWREAGRALLVLMLVAPAAFAGFRAAALGADTTQSRARRWLEENVRDQELVVQEAHGARLLDRWEAQRVTGATAFQRADTSWRRRYLQRRVLRTVTIPLLVAGRAVVTARRAGGALREIELFRSSADLNRVFYDPALFTGVDWVVTSDAVRGRYRADTTRYAAQVAFYRLLESLGDSAATFRSGGRVTGPELRIHRLDDSTRAALRARFGPLDPFWWTRDVPAAARAELESTMTELGAGTDTSQAPPLWIRGLGTLFERQIEFFAYQTALELAEIGRCRDAAGLAEAILRMSPGHLQACGIVVTCAPATGDFAAARRALERLLAMRDPDGGGLADIRLEYAQVLSQTGDFVSARRELQRVLAAPLQRGETARRARALLDRIGSSPAP